MANPFAQYASQPDAAPAQDANPFALYKQDNFDAPPSHAADYNPDGSLKRDPIDATPNLTHVKAKQMAMGVDLSPGEKARQNAGVNWTTPVDRAVSEAIPEIPAQVVGAAGDVVNGVSRLGTMGVNAVRHLAGNRDADLQAPQLPQLVEDPKTVVGQGVRTFAPFVATDGALGATGLLSKLPAALRLGVAGGITGGVAVKPSARNLSDMAAQAGVPFAEKSPFVHTLDDTEATATLKNMGDAAVQGAGWPLALKAGAYVARPVLSALGGVADTAARGIGGAFADIAGPQARAKYDQAVALDKVRRDLANAKITDAQSLDAAAAPYQGRPATLADLGRAPNSTVTALVRKPGETADLAAGVLEDRQTNRPARMLGDLEQHTGIDPHAADAQIETMKAAERAKAKPLYEAAEQVPFQTTQRLDALMSASPTGASALKEADRRMADFAAAQGVPVDSLPPLRRYDEAKKILDEEEQNLIKFGKSPAPVEQVRSALIKELDGIVPGYAQARAAGSGAPLIDEGAALGKKAFGAKNADDILAQYQKLNGTAATAVQTSGVKNLMTKIEGGRMTPRVASNPNFQRQIKGIFGDQAGQKLLDNWKAEGQMAQTEGRWNPNVGSATGQALQADPNAEGNAVLGVAKGLHQVSKGNILGPIMDTLAALRRVGYSENQLNEIGKLLLSDPAAARAKLFPGGPNTPPASPSALGGAATLTHQPTSQPPPQPSPSALGGRRRQRAQQNP